MRSDNGNTPPALGESEVISSEAFAMLGAGDVAYVRPQAIEGRTIYLIFSAEGEQIGGYENREVAFAACRQNDLEPLSAH